MKTMVITVQCTECSTSFLVDTAKVPEGGIHARCSECPGVFFVEHPAEEDAPLAAVAAVVDALEEAGSEAWAADESEDELTESAAAVEEERSYAEPPAWGAVAEAAEIVEQAGEDFEEVAEEFDESTDGLEGAAGELQEAAEEFSEAAEEYEEARGELEEAAGELEKAAEELEEAAEEFEAAAELAQGTLDAEEGFAASGDDDLESAGLAIMEAEVEEEETQQDMIAFGMPTLVPDALEAEEPTLEADVVAAAVEPALDDAVLTPEDIAFEAQQEAEEPAVEGDGVSPEELPTAGNGLTLVEETSEAAEVAEPTEEAEAAPAPMAFTFGRRDPKEKAERLARVLVSDMIMYNPERHTRALENGTLRQDFEEEIQKSWDEYVGQVGEETANDTPFFHDALNEILARGEQLFP